MVTSRTILGGLAVLAMGACGGGSSGGNGPPQVPPVTPTTSVTIINNQFSPPNAGVGLGATVTWTWNSGGQDHNVRWDASASLVDSPTKSSGTYQQTFNVAGVYHYFCNIHSGMEGYVTVQ